jgi:uncharacterized surface protein with fasciclin (FAS1) repeats
VYSVVVSFLPNPTFSHTYLKFTITEKMQIKTLISLALATAVSAQNTMNLTAALGSVPELSNLTQTLGLFEALVAGLAMTPNITILAPSNTAFGELMSGPGAAALNDTALIQAVLQYHVLNGTYYAANVTETPAFIPTALMNTSYTNVTGGQVVKAMTMDGNVFFYSGLLANSSVAQPVSQSLRFLILTLF